MKECSVEIAKGKVMYSTVLDVFMIIVSSQHFLIKCRKLMYNTCFVKNNEK